MTTTADGGNNYVGTASAKVIVAIAVNADDNNIQSLVDTQISDQGDKANLNIIDTSRVTDMNSCLIRSLVSMEMSLAGM